MLAWLLSSVISQRRLASLSSSSDEEEGDRDRFEGRIESVKTLPMEGDCEPFILKLKSQVGHCFRVVVREDPDETGSGILRCRCSEMEEIQVNRPLALAIHFLFTQAYRGLCPYFS